MTDFAGPARAFASGAAFGWNDEIEAWFRTIGRAPTLEELASGKSPYEAERDRIRALQMKYEEEHPYLSEGLSLAGSVAPFLIPGAGAALAGGRGALTAGRMAAAGAGIGAVQGAGDAEHMSDIPLGAAIGAGVGGALGAVTPAASRIPKALREAASTGEEMRQLLDLLNKYKIAGALR